MAKKMFDKWTIGQIDRAAISVYVMNQLRRAQISLKENARQILISKAIRAFIDTSGNYPYMQKMVDAEIDLLTALERNSDRVMNVCETGINPHTLARLQVYFEAQGAPLQSDSTGYFAVVPRSFDIPEIRKKIKRILNGDYD